MKQEEQDFKRKDEDMLIKQNFLTENPCYKENKKIAVKGLMLHSVGCPQPSAKVFIDKWNKKSYDKACVHAFIDANNDTVYQTLPWNMRGWHCGGSGNNTHIGVEMCEPPCLTYTGGSSFTCSNYSMAREMVTKTYKVAVELFANLCAAYKLNPLTKGVIVSHSEGHKMGIASGHADPEHLWSGLSLPYTMDTFRKDVKSKMSEKNQNGKVQDDKFVWDYLISKGFSEVAAAGIMGNMYAESGIRSNNLQNSYEKSLGMTDVEYTQSVDDGSYSKDSFLHDKAGYGLCQWTYWSRKQNLYNMLKEKNLSIGDLKGQLDYFLYEIKGYTYVYEQLMNAKTVFEASNAILLGYEKPANQSIENQKTRASYGQRYYDKYANSSFLVKVEIPNLAIRKGPGTNYEKTGKVTGVGTFTIIETAEGEGSENGWGCLKSGMGWISLDFATRK